ncbi:hypothetical protein JCM8547_008412 [Rhodosporidiobolus lusitaniae]
MVKVTSSLIFGAALVASSAPALAAPTRHFARNTAELAKAKDADAPVKTEETDATKETVLDKAPVERRSFSGDVKPITASDRIRRGLPLTPEVEVELDKRDLITDLGLDGTLAPLGLGDLLPTLMGPISGLPVVGAPVGGLVSGLDSAVGVSKLLQPKTPAADAAASPAPAPAAPATKRDLLSTLTGTLGGLPVVGGPASGVLNTVPGVVGSTPLGGVLGQLQGNQQLSSLLGQLQALGLGNLPLSQLSQLQSIVSNNPAGSVLASTPSGGVPQTATKAANATTAVPGTIMNQLSVAQAEQLGLLAPGTAKSLLATLEVTIETAAPSSPLAYAFHVAPHGFKAAGNETDSTTTPSSNSTATPTSTSSSESSGPTFAIASPETVASAMAHEDEAPAPSSTGKSFAAYTDEPEEDDEEDSLSEYSDDGEEDSGDEEDEDASIFAAEDSPHSPGLEGQGPNASGAHAWHTASVTSASGEASASATAKAMSLSYSDASATAVPTSTGNAKRWARQLD